MPSVFNIVLSLLRNEGYTTHPIWKRDFWALLHNGDGRVSGEGREGERERDSSQHLHTSKIVSRPNRIAEKKQLDPPAFVTDTALKCAVLSALCLLMHHYTCPPNTPVPLGTDCFQRSTGTQPPGTQL